MKQVMIALLGVLALSGAIAQNSISENIEEGYANLERKDCPFAQYLFREVLEQEQDNVEARVGNGIALTCQGAYVLGIEEFETARDLDPQNVKAAVELAKAYQSQYSSDPDSFRGKLDEALIILQEAEQIAPEDPEVLNGKGAILFYQGNIAEARTAFERAISLAPDNDTMTAQMYVNLGGAYRELDEQELALQAFRRAVTLNPESAIAHNNVGWTYFNLGLDRCDDAIYELTQATKLNPGYIDARVNLAVSLFNCGSVADSIPHFEAALELPGALNFPPLYTYLSRAYVEQGQLDEAVRRAQQGALLPPVTADAFYHLAQAYEAREASGDAARAKEAYESALEIDPNYQAAQESLNTLP